MTLESRVSKLETAAADQTGVFGSAENQRLFSIGIERSIQDMGDEPFIVSPTLSPEDIAAEFDVEDFEQVAAWRESMIAYGRELTEQ